MKVNEGVRFSSETVAQKKERQATRSNSFQQIMIEQTNRMSAERLKQLFDEAQKLGEQLIEQRTMEKLLAYKRAVRQFAQEAVSHGIGIKETRGMTFRGDERRLKILRQLDKELLALTDKLLREESSTLDLLASIGEIKGLLLNLLT